MTTTGRRPLNLWSRTAAMTIARGAGTVAQLVATVVLVRTLSPSEWSSFSLFFSIYVPAVGIGGLNIHQSILYFFGRVRYDERRAVVAQTLTLTLVPTLLTTAIVAGLSGLLPGDFFNVRPLLPLLALIVALEIPTIMAQPVLLGMERPGLAAAFDGGLAALQTACVLIPGILGYGPTGIAWGLLFYAGFRMALFLFVVTRVTPPGPITFPSARMREQVTYAVPLGLTVASGLLGRAIDKWIVAALDAPSFGAYAVAAIEVPLLSVLPYSISAVLGTRMVHAFATGNQRRVLDYWLAQTSRMSLFIVPCTLGLVLCAPEIITLAAPHYPAAVLPFQIYTLILLHRVAEYGLVLRSAGRTRELWFGSLVLLIGNVLFGVPLTLLLGMPGAALGSLLAYAASWTYVLSRIATVLTVPFGRAFPFSVYGRCLVLCTLAFLGVTFVATHLESGIGTRIGVKAVFYAGFVVLGIRMLRLRASLHPVPAEDDSFHATHSPSAAAIPNHDHSAG